MKKITFLIFILFLSCRDKQKQCDVEHTVYEKANNGKEVVKIVRDCDNTVGTMYQILRISDDSVVYDGYYKEYYPSGKLKMLGFFKNGLQDSSTIVFHESGIKEVENYFVDGKLKGFQSEYYNNGKYKNRCYYVKDSMKILCVFYNINGQIEKIEGKAINVFYDREPDNLKIGDNIYIFNEVPIMEELITELDIKLVNEKGEKKVDATTQSFQFMDNEYFKGVKFTPYAKGTYKYSAVVSLINKANHSVVKKDTMSFPIIVR